MSENQTEAGANDDADAAAALVGGMDSVFSRVMDVVVNGEDPAEAGENEPPAGEAAPAGAVGAPEAEAAGADAPGADAGVPVAGGEQGDPPAAGDPAAGGAEGVGGDAANPGSDGGGVEYESIREQVAQLSTGLEEAFAKQFHEEALNEARETHAKFFEAIQKNPRLLVGTQVPALNGSGELETLRDSQDAKDWQEAVRSILSDEIRTNAMEAMNENAESIQVLNSAAQLFSENKDLIPGVKGFDRELADRFAKMAAPYEVRLDGKLSGYGIDVQPLINSIRADLKASRAAKPATPAAPAAPAAPAKTRAPQAAIKSKAAAAGGEANDFSPLFGTLGLPNIL